MASGKPCAYITQIIPPETSYATLAALTGASTPAENVLRYAFDNATVEYLDLVCRMFDYDAAGVTLTLPFDTDNASGTVVWEAAFRRIDLNAENLISDTHPYAFNASSATTVPSVVGDVVNASITFTDGADMDSVPDGEVFILRLRRASSTNTANANLWASEILIANS